MQEQQAQKKKDWISAKETREEGGFRGGTVDGNPLASAEDTGLIPSLGRFHNYGSLHALEPTTEKFPRETVQRTRPSKITSNTTES